MSEHVTLYLTRLLTSADLQESGAEPAAAGGNGLVATAIVADVQLNLNDAPPGGLQKHVLGLRTYVASQCHVHDRSVLAQIDKIVQSLGVIVEPGLDSGGEVLRFVRELARRGEGFLFRSDGLYSPDGLLLANPRSGDEADDDSSDEDEDEEVPPPDAERVLRRAWALCAVSLRGLAAAHGDRDNAGRDVARLREFVASVGLGHELEEEERDFISAEATDLAQRQIVNATWRIEGAVVLAWALGACELPDHQTQCEAAGLFKALGFLWPRAAAVDPPKLRDPDVLEWQHSRLLGLHWRLRDFSLAPRPVDLRALANGEIWFGGFDLDGIALVEDDLEIGGAPIARADPERVQVCRSIASERHQAIRWLDGYATKYSAVDTST